MLPNIFRFSNFDFSAGNLTSHGGILPITTWLAQNHFLDFLEQVPFGDSRKDPEYSNSEILASRILFNLSGTWGCSARYNLKDDPLFFDINMPSQSTDSRLKDRITQQTVDFHSDTLTEMACKRVASSSDEVILDQDSTVIETYGNQKYAGYIPHYGTDGYHPLLISEHYSNAILAAWLRPGNTYASLGSWEQLCPVVQQLRKNNPSIDIKYRADSAGFNSDFMKQLESESITYHIRRKNTHKLRTAIENDLDVKNVNFMDYTHAHPYIGEITYTVSKSVPRRVVYKAYQAVSSKGQPELIPTIYCVITNDEAQSAQEVMDFYEARGTSENVNKDLKNDFFAGNLSHKEINQNAVDLLLCAMCCNFYTFFRQDIFEGKDQSMRMSTFRQVLGSIGAKIIRHARSIQISYASNFWNRKKFEYYLKKVITCCPAG